MTAVYVWLAEAWDFLTGLRISTRRQREHAEAELLGVRRLADSLDRERSRAEEQKREAQRILTIITEPLKDWDLNDFPVIAGTVQNQKPTTLSWEHGQHLAAVVRAYQIVARDAAQARMSVTFNDRARQRGWDDQPIRPTPSGQRRDPRRLP